MEHNFNDEKASRRGQYVEAEVDLMKDRMFFTFDTSYGMPSMPGEATRKPEYKEYKIKTVGILEEGTGKQTGGVYAPLDVVQDMIKEKEKKWKVRALNRGATS